MPGDGRRVGERGHLVNDDATVRGAGSGRVPGRAQQWVQRAGGAALDGVGQFGQQFALPGLGRDDPARFIT